jgi:hypothetical protein
MDRSLTGPDDTLTVSDADAAEGIVDDASRPFVGTWHKLVSSTNWEKGRIIATWREAQIAAGVDASLYSDEAWAQMVGDVTSQHVGRLRRVFDRFGVAHPEYPGLYWSHFHAALDWEDAEIWLEGAVQKKWSIAAMRRQRDQVYGQAPKTDAPEVVTGRLSREPSDESEGAPSETVEGNVARVQDIDGEAYTADGDADFEASSDRPHDEPAATQSAVAKSRPFANLAALPDDMADAFENFKLAILHHKLTGWTDISLDDVLASLDALKLLAQAPSE